MSANKGISEFRWYAVQTLSNQEGKAKRYLEKFIGIEKMGDFVRGVLMPSETVTEVKNGRKSAKIRKFYPGYLFIETRLYDDESKLLQEVWAFIRNTQGIIGFVGGDSPAPLKPEEMDRILNQVKGSEGKEVPKVQYEVGEVVKIIDGPFLNLTGNIESIDLDKGKLKVSVSMFGRFTPVELEFWQIERVNS
ncbi:MAG: transcription termination/antitermination factor NusG [Verrucomicrobia bacterium GWF2_51_19]|nr:MAG: transcription termination/antitermination factor NusG [Verrucomicrobia bacterium GWF2_51_19]HCJ12560.1 transcription termination/antitermination factor NusG [Opitutae bacterium]